MSNTAEVILKSAAIFSNDPVALAHYGIKYRSGRYEYGSGENPYQHDPDFYSRCKALKDSGMREVDIAKEMGFSSTTEYRKAYSIARGEKASRDISTAKSMAGDGVSTSEIARRMGRNEATIRYWLNSESEERASRSQKTANQLLKEIEEKGCIDVGPGVEHELGVSRQVLDNAIKLAEESGAVQRKIYIQQPNNPKHQTTVTTLSRADVTYQDIRGDLSKIQSVGEYHSEDGGKSWWKREYPASISSDRVSIRYGDEGGIEKDGVIEIRRGVADLDLGNSHYAQVRIMVDGTHYLKGMAMYSDDLPEGADIVFNTNKQSGTDKMSVLKKIKSDPDNPFGAYIKAGGQSHYTDSDGNEHLSAINKLKEEGDWDTQSRNLSSQFLSKQPMQLINQQLNLTIANKQAQYDEINSVTNDAVKRKLLNDFAESCESAAVNMKAAALPRQSTRVILPVSDLKDTECYAPYLNNGDEVVLVRYPHAGTFELPRLTVNNKNASAKKALGNATDAIGINSKVAEVLSGADFDGDTVVVIPTSDKVKIKTKSPLAGLKDFDPKTTYSTTAKTRVNSKGEEVTEYFNAAGEKVSVMSATLKGREMGIVSNLITDMTLSGNATESEIARAVRHSMVVIDAEKHKLDYKKSYSDNGIEELKNKYQIKYDPETGEQLSGHGATTLISRRKNTVDIPEVAGSGRVDPETGEKTYRETGRTYIDKKTGETKQATSKKSIVLDADDVMSLSTGTPQENAYARYANKMKALANEARKTAINTPLPKKDPGAAKKYASEVASLNEKIKQAEANKPRERRAQALANATIEAKKIEYPELTEKANKKDLQKVSRLAMDEARAKTGAKAAKLEVTDREWEAIQAHAVSGTAVEKILRYADSDAIVQRATPKATVELVASKQNRLKALLAAGYTQAEVAQALGCSVSTVNKYANA